jgi:hypothetical protein
MLTTRGTTEQIESLGDGDILLTPEFGEEYSSVSFARLAETIETGYLMTMERREELASFQLSAEEYAAYRAGLTNPRMTELPTIDFIRMGTTEPLAPSVIDARIQDIEVGQPLDLDALETALNQSFINFNNPNGFYEEYAKRYGANEWGAVSWEYAAIMDLWRAGAEKAGSAEPDAVLAAMKEGGKGQHIFGEADWWGKDLFGIDNALVGNWPVVVIEDGKAVIKEFRSIPDWWAKHKDVMIKHFEAMGEMFYQRS